MAASKNQGREAREARERLTLYNARQAVYAHKVSRRRRDNVIAALGVLVVIALATATQVFYFSAGPGMPTASPSASAQPDAGATVGDVPDASTAEIASATAAWHRTNHEVIGDDPDLVVPDQLLAPPSAKDLP